MAPPAKKVSIEEMALGMSLGPAGVQPRLDSHAYLPMPPGWSLCHDNRGSLHRAFKGPPERVQWRHPDRQEEPVQLAIARPGTRLAGAQR